MSDHFKDVMDTGKNQVVGRSKWHGNFCGEPGDSVGDELSTGVEHPDGVTTIRVKCWANVPAVIGMWGAGGSDAGLCMYDEDMNARRSNGCSVEIVLVAILELGPCGELWVETGAT